VLRIADSAVIPENPAAACWAFWFDGNPFLVGQFVPHDSSPGFGNLNHRRTGQMQRSCPWLGSSLTDLPAESGGKDPQRTLLRGDTGRKSGHAPSSV